MHSVFEITGIVQANDNICASSSAVAPVLLHTNHILEQIHSLPTTQQLFLEHHHHLLPTHHQYDGGTSTYFPAVNFKLGLNEICSRKEQLKDRRLEEGSYKILHCWNDQQDSSLKQQPFWEPLPAEVSQENSEIVDHIELNHKQILTPLDPKDQFGELEAIYKRCEKKTLTITNHQSEPHHPQMNNSTSTQIPSDFDSKESRKKRRKKKKKGSGYYSSQLMNPVTEFFNNFVKKMMDHQEILYHKFTEMIERLDEERRAREEYWRNQEMAHLEQEAMARDREKRLAQSREAMIFSYLEKITGQKVNFSSVGGEDIMCTGNEVAAEI